MFITFKNYLKIFNLFLYNKFQEGLKNSAYNFDGGELKDLKTLQNYLKDGIIDTKEAKIISENISKIEGEARIGLNEITNEMFQKGFSAKDKKSYNSFKKLIEKTNGQKLPEWDSIIRAVSNNISPLNDMFKWGTKPDKSSNFHGIEVKNGEILVRYDGFGFNDTLKLKFDNTGNIKKDSGNWIEEGGEENDYENKSELTISQLDDNILGIEQKEINRKQDIKIKEQEEINRKQDIKIKEQEKINQIQQETIDIHSQNIKQNTNKIEEVETEIKRKAEAKKNEEIAREAFQKAERKERERDNKEYFKDQEIIKWNKSEFTNDGIKLIQKKLGVKIDGYFGPNTLEAVKKIDKDGKIGLGVLKKLGLVDKNNNAINGLTKFMFKPGKLEKGNSRYIIFKENKRNKIKENKQNSNPKTKPNPNLKTNQEKIYKKFDMEKTPETKQILNILGKAELKEAFDGLREGNGDTWKKTIGKIHGKEVIIFQVLNQKYLEIKTGNWYKNDPEMKINSYKDINQKNIENLYSKIK